MLVRSTHSNISGGLYSLREKCITLEGLMLSPETENIVKPLLPEIDVMYDGIMLNCARFAEDDILPGTSTTKLKVMTEKSEFDARVKEWLESKPLSIVRESKQRKPSSHKYDCLETQTSVTKCTSRTSWSGMSSKHKAVVVKSRLAIFDKNIEAERFRVAEENFKHKEEIERIQEESLRKALESQQLAEQLAKEANREAEKKRDFLKRQEAQRERTWEAQKAAVEAQAW